jgi:hypothetical protein
VVSGHPDQVLIAEELVLLALDPDGRGPKGPRVATLLALAGPSQLLEVAAPVRSDRSKAKRRIADAAQQVPAAAAVRYVIESMQVLIVAATTAAPSGR